MTLVGVGVGDGAWPRYRIAIDLFAGTFKLGLLALLGLMGAKRLT
ncbi:hypothetical protein [Caulobacter sp.]|nr:hypothetical protein [Caulobacter sp.]